MERLSILLLAVALFASTVALPSGKKNDTSKESTETVESVLSIQQIEVTDDMLNSCKYIPAEAANPLLRNGITNPSAKWPNNQVPYVLSSGFTAEQKATIVRGFDVYGKWTCVTFVPRTTQVNYLNVLSNNDGCWSEGGFQNKGEQRLNLQPNGCVYEGHAFHESMHTLGFAHEQDRHDRDSSIIYNIDLIGGQGVEKQYDNSAWGVPYDYFSAMHYGQTYYNGKPLFTATRDMHGRPFGSKTVFSWSDVRRVNRLYGCAASYEQAIDVEEYKV